MNLVEGLLVKYSVQTEVSGHYGGCKVVQSLTQCHFTRRVHPTEGDVYQQDSVRFAASMTKKVNLFIV